jgi:nucleoid-associated protein YgaU
MGEIVASLSAHLTAGPEHGRLGFHPECARCREQRLAGSLHGDELVSRRAQAALAAGVLAISTAMPTVSLAAEPDQVQEGGASPSPEDGTGGSLDDPSFDPGGEDTPLEIDTGAPSGSPDAGGDTDESVDTPPLEEEEQDDPEGRLVLGEQPAETGPIGAEPAPLAPPQSDPVVQTPETQPAAPGTPPAAVRLVERRQEPREPTRQIVLFAPAPETKDRAGPVGVPTAQPTVGLAVDSGPGVSAGNIPVSQPAGGETALVQGDSYTVREGDSLWSIARRLLGPDASNGQVAREVNRLWMFNDERIGTGDPSLLRVGTVLRLG